MTPQGGCTKARGARLATLATVLGTIGAVPVLVYCAPLILCFGIFFLPAISTLLGAALGSGTTEVTRQAFAVLAALFGTLALPGLALAGAIVVRQRAPLGSALFFLSGFILLMLAFRSLRSPEHGGLILFSVPALFLIAAGVAGASAAFARNRKA